MCLTLYDPIGCSLPDSSVSGILQARILEWVPSLQGILLTQGSNSHLLCLPALADGFFRAPPGKPSPGDLPNPGIEPRSPELQADSLPSEPSGKPMNTGVGSLSILQGIFPFQESNQGLLHCRQILYQLSYQGSPTESLESAKIFVI